jgi:hypothetical protein
MKSAKRSGVPCAAFTHRVSPRARARAPTVPRTGCEFPPRLFAGFPSRSREGPNRDSFAAAHTPVSRLAESGGNSETMAEKKAQPKEGSPRPRPGGNPGNEKREEKRGSLRRLHTPDFPSRSREGPNRDSFAAAHTPVSRLAESGGNSETMAEKKAQPKEGSPRPRPGGNPGNEKREEKRGSLRRLHTPDFPSRSREGPNRAALAATLQTEFAFGTSRGNALDNGGYKAPRRGAPGQGRGEIRGMKRTKRSGVPCAAFTHRISPCARARAPTVPRTGCEFPPRLFAGFPSRSREGPNRDSFAAAHTPVSRLAESGGNSETMAEKKAQPKEGSPRPRPGGNPGNEKREEKRGSLRRLHTPDFPSRFNTGCEPDFPSRSREGPNRAPHWFPLALARGPQP